MLPKSAVAPGCTLSINLEDGAQPGDSIRVRQSEDITGPGAMVQQAAVREHPQLGQQQGRTVLRTMRFRVRLAEGVTLMVTGFINIQNRARLGLQSPGVDLLAPCPANESGSFVVLQNGMLVHAVCWPPGLQAATLNNMTRPAAFPGVQQLRPTLPAQALNCSNSSDVHPLERCWPLRGLYQDVAMSGQDPDEQGQLWPTNIFLRLLNMQFACVAVMTETCLKELGPTACFLYMSSTQRVAVRLSPQRPSAPGPSLPPSVAAAAVSVRPGGGEVSGSNRGRAGLPLLVVVLPCVLGVLLITTVAAVFVWFLAARYWRADRRAGWRLPGHSDGSDKLAAASGADSPPAGAQLCKGRSSESLDPVGSQGSTDVLQRQPSKGGGAGPRNRLDAGYGEAARRAHAVMSSTTAETAEVKVLAGTSAPIILVVFVGSVACGYILAPDALVIVTPFTPHRSDLKLDVQCDTEVKLLPVVRGQGPSPVQRHLPGPVTCTCDSRNFGRVVEGLYGGQRVAVKLVPDLSQWSGAGGPAALQSYVQEVEVLGRCQHPNVVRLLAACVTPPRLCLVMELMDTSLDRLIHAIPQPGPPQQAAPTSTGQEVQLGTSSVRGGASSRSDGCGCGGSSGGEGGREISDRGFMLMPLDKVLHVGLEVARGLEYLHPTIVHRDLKPGNVLLNDPYGPRPVVKLTDFGLSRLRSSVLVTRHPEAGTVCAHAWGQRMSTGQQTQSVGVFTALLNLWDDEAACPRATLVHV
ncbi:hypothetical protein VOLCADRAFT_87540 [Volvox carteri f. nagariensis]|uniref:Protein kinase domain-containing protein n=1 Tax=Volvox carteri f. nagariensis TaxID=3068 RepID=D8TLK4_VOLCA|nr:uncharacterized protein VOLCADRAFT_87540 [Volvox carteri f. nagariensis]EFJ51889.1 hypothetical protein VOLCADRAFT_87540 [Volvox carteri f. nagariensis]|eukprot:XP_002947299.1 hypothetical protein VOLCADRAFT_87540 [Volvox carteri f. nagariensis]